MSGLSAGQGRSGSMSGLSAGQGRSGSMSGLSAGQERSGSMPGLSAGQGRSGSMSGHGRVARVRRHAPLATPSRYPSLTLQPAGGRGSTCAVGRLTTQLKAGAGRPTVAIRATDWFYESL